MFFRVFHRTYFAALIGVGFFIPTIASIATVGLYIGLSSLPLSQPWCSIVWGTFFTTVLWFILAACGTRFATVEGANSRSYALLKSGLADLEVHLGINKLGEQKKPTLEEKNAARAKDDACNPIAFAKAHSLYQELQQLLTDQHYGTGLEWVLGTGYTNGWKILHRAQEALIEFESASEVIRAAMYIQQALHDSNIGNKDVLLSRLMQAIKDLDPVATIYFEEHHPESKAIHELRIALARQGKAIHQIETILQQLGYPFATDARTAGLDQSTPPTPDIAAQRNARIVISEIKQALNSFRDHTWDRLLRGRNRILGAIVLTGLGTHIMLCLVLLSQPDYTQIMAATVFYMIGAIAGLFRQFYAESTKPTTVDDYGLSLVRLVATPLLSGLAGISGVFISLALALSTAAISNGHSLGTSSIHSVFSVQPEYLLIAAFSGLTPNLIIRSLQQQANQYAADLQSSKSASNGSPR